MSAKKGKTAAAEGAPPGQAEVSPDRSPPPPGPAAPGPAGLELVPVRLAGVLQYGVSPEGEAAYHLLFADLGGRTRGNSLGRSEAVRLREILNLILGQ